MKALKCVAMVQNNHSLDLIKEGFQKVFNLPEFDNSSIRAIYDKIDK